MKNKIVRFPISFWQRRKNKMGPGYVPCMISEKQIQFPKKSGRSFGSGELISISIMTTNAEEKQSKICDMVITREDLLSAIDSVKERS